VLVASHVQRRTPGRPGTADKPPVQGSRRARTPTSGPVVTRIADNSGAVSFAGTNYAAGRAWRGTQLQVAIVAGSVQLSSQGKVVRIHPIRHDRAKEHAAFACPNGRPRTHHQDAPDGPGVKATPLRGRPAGRALTPTPQPGPKRAVAGSASTSTGVNQVPERNRQAGTGT
jgi:hypothetical protein